jgi:TonB family protein
MVVLFALAAVAAEPLAEVAERDGFEALLVEVRAEESASKNKKKLQKALDERGLSAVSMPVVFTTGAELLFNDASGLSACTWSGAATCSFDASVTAGTDLSAYRVSCESKYGATLPLAAKSSAGDRASWVVSGVEKCWEMDAIKIVVSPEGVEGLDGWGIGDENHDAEAIRLQWYQVEELIGEQLGQFKYCLTKGTEGTAKIEGSIEIGFDLDAEGTVIRAEVEKSTLGDDAVEECVRTRFERMKFPPPMGGVSGGSYPFDFSS